MAPAMDASLSHDHGLPRGLIILFAIACGAMVANIYYAQTLIEQIGPDIGLSPQSAGLITTLTQLGYGAGLALFVPLGDLFENRRLALIALSGAVLGTIGIAASQGPTSFLLASVLTGICSTGAQILLPLATHLTPRHRQGAVIGQVMSGLLAGIMLSRPLASFAAALIGWRAIFVLSAVVMILIGVILALHCPQRRPDTRIHYATLIGSVWRQLGEHRALRLRAFYQALLFAAFNLFWTTAPLALIHHFGLSQTGIAIFALAGAGGALIAPMAGRLADQGRGWMTTLFALAGSAAMFLAADIAVAITSIAIFGITAILVDASVQANQITGQRIIFGLSSHARGRINAAYMTSIFVVGASGSVIGTMTYERYGWSGTALAGLTLCAIPLLAFLFFDRGASRMDHPPRPAA